MRMRIAAQTPQFAECGIIQIINVKFDQTDTLKWSKSFIAVSNGSNGLNSDTESGIRNRFRNVRIHFAHSKKKVDWTKTIKKKMK